jgi:hypothetical protein
MKTGARGFEHSPVTSTDRCEEYNDVPEQFDVLAVVDPYDQCAIFEQGAR